MQAVHDKHAFANNETSISVDLGCGLSPSNLFKSATCNGVDLFENSKENSRREESAASGSLSYHRCQLSASRLLLVTTFGIIHLSISDATVCKDCQDFLSSSN